MGRRHYLTLNVIIQILDAIQAFRSIHRRPVCNILKPSCREDVSRRGVMFCFKTYLLISLSHIEGYHI